MTQLFYYFWSAWIERKLVALRLLVGIKAAIFGVAGLLLSNRLIGSPGLEDQKFLTFECFCFLQGCCINQNP